MKIKAIKLTNKHEIQREQGYLLANTKYTPVYQVEYEETTNTGLTAKGTVELRGDDLEKVMELLSSLEDSLSKEYEKKESKDEKVDYKGKRSRLHNAEAIYPYAKIRKALDESFNAEPDMPFDNKGDSDELVDLATDLATCLGVDDKFIDEIKKLFKKR